MSTTPDEYGRHAACPDCGRRLTEVIPLTGGPPVPHCRNFDCPGHTMPPPDPPPATAPAVHTYPPLYSTRDSERIYAGLIREELTRRRRNGQWA